MGDPKIDLKNAWTKLSRQVATTIATPLSEQDAYRQLGLAKVIPYYADNQNPFLPGTSAVSGMIYSPNDLFKTVGSGTSQLTFQYKDTNPTFLDHVAVTDGNYVYQTIAVNNSAQPYMLVNVYTVEQWAAISNPSWQPPAPPAPPAALKKASTPTETPTEPPAGLGPFRGGSMSTETPAPATPTKPTEKEKKNEKEKKKKW